MNLKGVVGVCIGDRGKNDFFIKVKDVDERGLCR